MRQKSLQNQASQSLTMGDIARLAGVSKPTVSRALNNSPSVAEATRKHVLAVAKEHGYAVNHNARKLRAQHTETVAVIVDARSHPEHRIADPFIFELLAGVSEALSVRGKTLLLITSTDPTPEEYRHMLASKLVDGFIFLGQGQRHDDFQALARLNVPFVVWGTKLEGARYCTVGSDNAKGGVLAAEHLLSHGGKSFLFIGNRSHAEIRERWNGFQSTIAKRDPFAHSTALDVENFSFEGSRQGFSRYLDRAPMPDSIFCFSDTAAMAVISILREKNIRVPEDCRVVGYNDIPTSGHFFPSLTTIRQDPIAAGTILVEKLMQSIDGAQASPSVIATDLIVRCS